MVTTKYTNLANHLRAWGLKVEEINGWQTRSANSTTFTPIAVMAHHTAGSATGNAPTLQYIINNRLAQFVLGRDGTVYLVSGNRANHGGLGGPKAGIPKDSANRYSWGIEAENTGRGEPWSKVQLNAYYRLTAALLAMMKKDANSVIAHKEWAPTRKVDPAGIDMNGFRSNVAAALAAGPSGHAPDPVLSEGDSGQAVTNVQNALVKHGFLKASDVDGDFGPTTKGAVVAFQKSRGLVADGIVGARTWEALRKDAVAPAPAPAPTPTPTPLTGGKRMLVQFRGDNHVYEIVGSTLIHVTADAWRARGLTSRDVVILEQTHALNNLPKKNEY